MKASIKLFIKEISHQVQNEKLSVSEALNSLDQYRRAIKVGFSDVEEYERLIQMGISDIENLYFKKIGNKKVREVTKLNGNYSLLFNRILEDEFDNIMDGNWSISDERFLPDFFNRLDSDKKELYAIITAEQHTLNIMNYTISKFLNFFDYDYSDHLME